MKKVKINQIPHTSDQMEQESSQLRAQISELRTLLKEIQKIRYHEPNSDYHEYCNGCQRSPYNVPPHDDGCIVLRIAETLKRCKG